MRKQSRRDARQVVAKLTTGQVTATTPSTERQGRPHCIEFVANDARQGGHVKRTSIG